MLAAGLNERTPAHTVTMACISSNQAIATCVLKFCVHRFLLLLLSETSIERLQVWTRFGLVRRRSVSPVVLTWRATCPSATIGARVRRWSRWIRPRRLANASLTAWPSPPKSSSQRCELRATRSWSSYSISRQTYLTYSTVQNHWSCSSACRFPRWPSTARTRWWAIRLTGWLPRFRWAARSRTSTACARTRWPPRPPKKAGSPTSSHSKCPVRLEKSYSVIYSAEYLFLSCNFENIILM